MGLPVVPRAPANLQISAATSGTRTETITAGETLVVIVATTSGGAGPSVSGAGATWTTISNTTDGSRRVVVFRGDTPTTGSQTVTLSFTNSTTCRWSIVAATGIAAATPNAGDDSLTTASSTRTSSDCSSAGITTAANVLGVLALAASNPMAATITLPSGWTRITPSTDRTALGYIASSSAFASQKGTVTYGSTTASSQGCIAAFNGDDQTPGGPFPHYTRRRMMGGTTFPRGGL